MTDDVDWLLTRLDGFLPHTIQAEAAATLRTLREENARLQTLADGRAALGLNAVFMAEAIGVEGVEAARLDYEETLTAPLRAALAGRDATIAAALEATKETSASDFARWKNARHILAASPTDALAADRARVWDEGFMGCANWWEIHHAASVLAERNPYTVKKEQADRDRC